MSIFQKGHIDLKRTFEKRVVTIMLSFSFFLEKKCDANFDTLFGRLFRRFLFSYNI